MIRYPLGEPRHRRAHRVLGALPQVEAVNGFLSFRDHGVVSFVHGELLLGQGVGELVFLLLYLLVQSVHRCRLLRVLHQGGEVLSTRHGSVGERRQELVGEPHLFGLLQVLDVLIHEGELARQCVLHSAGGVFVNGFVEAVDLLLEFLVLLLPVFCGPVQLHLLLDQLRPFLHQIGRRA